METCLGPQRSFRLSFQFVRTISKEGSDRIVNVISLHKYVQFIRLIISLLISRRFYIQRTRQGILNLCFIPKISRKEHNTSFRLEMTIAIIWFNLFNLLIRKGN